MDALLKNLALDKWYKVATGVGVILTFIALTADTRWLTNKQTGLAGAGLFFIGLGAWKNIKHRVELVRPTPHSPAGYAKYSVSEADAVGIAFWAAGVLSLVWFVKDLFF